MKTLAIWPASSVWRRNLIVWAALTLAILVLYRETGLAMATIWYRSGTFAHAFLVPPISIWLAWRQRHVLAAIAPKPALWVLLPMAVTALAWLAGQVVAVNSVTQVALVGLLVLSVPLVWGLAAARALMFPLAFLFFSAPVGEFLLPVLMQWTADFTVAALRLTGVPVYREGLRFIIPSGSWSVVEACSGVRYLIASFMVGSLFGYLNYRSNKRRWIFVGVSILVPIVANWVRAYMIVMLGHLSNNQIATGVDHLVYGWVFFGVVIMALFMIGARWSEADAADPGLASTQGANVAPDHSAAPTWLAAALACLLCTAPLALLFQMRPGQVNSSELKLDMPTTMAGGWRLLGALPNVLLPKFENAVLARSATYANDKGQQVNAHVFYYRNQTPERKLVSSTNRVLMPDDAHWNALSTRARDSLPGGSLPSPAVYEINLVGPDRGGAGSREHMRAWQTYWINGQWTASDIRAKLMTAWDLFRGLGDDSAALILLASEAQPGGAEAALLSFMTEVRPALEASLMAARNDARSSH